MRKNNSSIKLQTDVLFGFYVSFALCEALLSIQDNFGFRSCRLKLSACCLALKWNFIEAREWTKKCAETVSYLKTSERERFQKICEYEWKNERGWKKNHEIFSSKQWIPNNETILDKC